MKKNIVLRCFPLSRVLMFSTVLISSVSCSLVELSHTESMPTPVNVKMTTDKATLKYVRNVEGIDEYLLSNGMKVLLYPDPAQPKTLVNITYRVGSIHENYGETGMAHLLEHMLFKGSTNYPNMDKEFDKRGMKINATTWLDRTNYFELFEANDENLEWALGMEADRMINATFSEDELKSEMTVVRNEMERGENNPFRILMARMDSSSYLWHNYANSTIGARSDVENFPFQRLRKFYDTHYRPDNAVLTVAGRFDKNKVLSLIEDKFGVLAQPEIAIEPLYTVEPTQDGERVVNLRRTGEVPIIGVQYHVPSALHQDTPAIQVLTEILSDQARGRLQKALVEKGLAAGQWAFSYLRKDPSNFTVLAIGSKDQDISELETSLINQVEELKTNKILESEVKNAKASILKSTEEGLRNVTSVGMNLSEFIAMGDYRYIFYYRDLVEKVTVEDVQRVAEKYLMQSNRTLGRFIPTKDVVRAEIAAADDISDILKDYKGREAIEAGEVYDNTVANIQSRLKTFDWGIGTKVSIYPKKLRGGEVRISMTLPTGSVESLKDYKQDFNMLGGLLYSGNAKYSKAEIASKLDELKASVNINTNSVGMMYVSIKALKKNLNATLEFVAEMLTTPKFESSEIAIDRKAIIASKELGRNEPSSIAIAALKKSFNGHEKGHPLAFQTIDEQISELNKVSQERLVKLHQSHVSFVNGHLGVVGDVNPEQFSALLEQTFGHLKGAVEYEEMHRNIADVKEVNSWSETPDKANAMLYIGHRIKLNQQHPDYLAAVIANHIFGGSGFASRLMQRIRVKEGYSYGTGSGLQLDFDDEFGVFTMRAISAPENIAKVIAAYKEEVEKAKNEGFTQDEVDNAIAGKLKSLRASWASDSYIASLIAKNTKLGRELTWYNDYENSISALTLEQVNEAFIKYVATDAVNIFTAGDFEKLKGNE